MQMCDVDNLMCIADGDSYACAMGMIFPTGGGNVQYYSTDASGNVSDVTPHLSTDNRQVYYPQVFSAIAGKYLAPSGIITFRVNSKTSDSAIIARGTLAEYANGSALVNGTGTWGQRIVDGALANIPRNQVFAVGTMDISDAGGSIITVPKLDIIGDVPVNTIKNSINIYAEVEMENGAMFCMEDFDIKPLSGDDYKVVIAAVNSAGGNDQVINTGSESITLTATLLRNGTAVTGLGTGDYTWHHFGDAGFTKQDGTTQAAAHGPSLTVGEALVPGHAIFVCDITYNGVVRSNSIDINDIQDQYIVNKGRQVFASSAANASEIENSNIIRRGNVVKYTPSVTDKISGSVSSGWTFSYACFDQAGSQVGSTSQGSTFTVLGETVYAHGGLAVRISASNSNI